MKKSSFNFLLRLFLLVCLLLTSELQAKGVIVEFNKAMAFYREQNFSKAQTQIKKILKLYPNHQPSIELQLKLYLDQGQYKNASRFIIKRKLNNLDPQTFFAIGLYYYNKGECSLTQYFLRRVPQGHVHTDDALIYRSVCYLREQKWSNALKLLNKVKEPSPSLVASHQELLSIARAANRQEIQGERTQQITSLARTPTLVYEQTPIVGPVKKGEPSTTLKQSPTTNTFGFKTTPKFEFEHWSDHADLHGYQTWDYQQMSYRAGTNLLAYYDFYLSQGRVGSLSLGLDVKFDTFQKVGEEIKNILSTGSTGGITSEKQEVDKGVKQKLSLKLSPSLSYPVNPYWSLLLNTSFQKNMLDLVDIYEISNETKTYKNAGYYSYGIGTKISVEKVVLEASFDSRNIMDEESTASVMENHIVGGISKAWDKMSADLKVSYIMRGQTVSKDPYAGVYTELALSLGVDYDFDAFSLGGKFGSTTLTTDPKVSLVSEDYGAAQTMGFSAHVSVPLPYKFSVTMNLGMDTLTDYTIPEQSVKSVPNSTKQADIKAAGQKMIMTPVVTYKPFDFLSIKASYNYEQIKWAVEHKEDQNTFETSTPNIYNKITFLLVFSKTI